MENMEDLYYREEKNPSKKKSGWAVFLKFLLPVIVLALIALLVFQCIALTKVSGAVAEAPQSEPA